MLTRFQCHVALELSRARAKFGPLHTAHEGYAVILEEVDELWEMVKQKQVHRSPAAMLKELVQIAAMCERMAEDLSLMNCDEGKGVR
jgi:hypothetical protein